MSVATPLARSVVRSTSTISRAEPRSISANAHACPTAPTPTTATLAAWKEAAPGGAGDRMPRSAPRVAVCLPELAPRPAELGGRDDEHRAGRVLDDVVRSAARQQRPQSGEPARAHDDEVV